MSASFDIRTGSRRRIPRPEDEVRAAYSWGDV